jgi:hypothetical protein
LSRPKTLPFRSFFVYKIIEGKKTCTARTRRYGAVGDVLDTVGGPIQLTEVVRKPLATVRDDYWRQEGLASPEDFERTWAALHPRRGFDPEQLVWLHRFVRVGDAPDLRSV